MCGECETDCELVLNVVLNEFADTKPTVTGLPLLIHVGRSISLYSMTVQQQPELIF